MTGTMLRGLAVRLLTVPLIAARLLAVRLPAIRLLSVRLLSAPLFAARLLAVRVLACVALMPAAAAAQAALGTTEVPDPLRSWIPWVLSDEREHACPRGPNGERLCDWPASLAIRADRNGAAFQMQVRTYRETWVPLPGEKTHWPQDVKAGTTPAIVTARNELPGVLLEPGAHVIAGTFTWQTSPDSLRVPANVALVELQVGGSAVSTPTIDEEGRLWLQSARQTADDAPRIELRVSRLLTDDVPFRIVTRLEIVASGRNQEVAVPALLLTGFVPLAIESPLAARLEADGRLRVQVRPGRWEIRVTSRSTGPVGQLDLPAQPAADTARANGGPVVVPPPAEEIWAFEARRALRLATVEGVAPVDPQQTTLPADWKAHPTFVVKAGDTATFNESRRGDTDPLPDRLALARTMWLDFDGGGYTVQDSITGTLSRSWRLEMASTATLGRVAIDGVDQLITRRADDAPAGFEVRRGRAQITADSRSASAAGTGWMHDFQQAAIQLHLPPGWRLIAATGVDRASGAWVSQWTLLDLFLACLVAVAVGKLFGWGWGALALVTIGLTTHEPGAPVIAWLAVIALVALARALPEGRFRGIAVGLRNVAFIVLGVALAAFVVGEVRKSLYPVLEQPYRTLGQTGPSAGGRAAPVAVPQAADQRVEAEADAPATPAAEPAPAAAARERRDLDQAANRATARLEAPRARAAGSSAYGKLDEVDPRALVQTGPGLPAWQWQTHSLGWTGPVSRDQPLGLWLLSPREHALVRVVRLILVIVLFALLAGASLRMLRSVRGAAGRTAAALLAGPLIAVSPVDDAHAQLPDAETLQTLREKLLAPPECEPNCASIARMLVTGDRDNLQVRIEVHATAPAVVPLPGNARQWDLRQVLLDAKPAATLRRDANGTVWARVTRGVHPFVLSIAPGLRDNIQVPLTMRPALVQTKLDGWTIEGLRDNGVPGDTLQLSRIRRETPAAGERAEQVLRPLLRIERMLQLGLQWRLHTRVTRLSPAIAPVVQEIDLLPGESVTAQDVAVKNGIATISLPAGATTIEWESALAETPEIRLVAAQRPDQIEVWQLAAGTRWHVGIEGIPVVQHQADDRWQPRWQPWPGEQVTIRVSRPQGVAGQTVTIDRSVLDVRPGARVSDATLTMTLRASRGEQHVIRLPEGAELQNVTIRGRVQPIRLEGRELRIPLSPGAQDVAVHWRVPVGMDAHFTTPVVDAGAASVNAAIRLQVPRDRWIIAAGGPAIGPAVLFWGVLVAVVLIAFGLSKISLTPLRFWQWLLLGLGFTQVPLVTAALVAGWLILLGWRKDRSQEARAWVFNLTQLFIAGATVVALALIVYAVQHGLLGYPDMQIAGNGSSASQLAWYQDRSDATLPTAWVLTVPVFAYRLLMLGWALWLAWSLVGWLKWGWTCVSAGGLWRSHRKAVANPVEPPPLPLPEEGTHPAS